MAERNSNRERDSRIYSRKSVFNAKGPDNKIYVMFHGTKKSNVSSILEKGFRISRKDCRTQCSLMLGPGLYLTRDLEKTRYYGDVCFKVLVYVGKTKTVNSADKTWHVNYDCAYLPPSNALVPSGREETCVKSVSQIEILGLAYGYDKSLMNGQVRNLEGTGDQLDEQEKRILQRLIQRMSSNRVRQIEYEELSCHHCRDSLAGHRYIFQDDHPYCIKCYENVLANKCDKCRKIIQVDSKDLSFKDKHWHEACFLCASCRTSLANGKFHSEADKIYCRSCHDEQFATRCDGCGDIFREGMKMMKYKTGQYHEKCFVCCACKNPIGTKSYFPKNNDIYCTKCHEDKFATKCIKCKKAITEGGLTYDNEPMHRECFKCTYCQKSLDGERFTSKDNKPYCKDCFDELYSERCTTCSKPITGKAVEYKTREYHEKCFVCCTCKKRIGKEGFNSKGHDIYCSKCHEDKFATKCIKCNKAMPQGGLTYNNEPWHLECFRCTHCQKSLASQRFTSKNDKPYCTRC